MQVWKRGSRGGRNQPTLKGLQMCPFLAFSLFFIVSDFNKDPDLYAERVAGHLRSLTPALGA